MKTNPDIIQRFRMQNQAGPMRVGILRRIDLYLTIRRLDQWMAFLDRWSRILGFAAIVVILFFILLPMAFQLWVGIR